MAPVPPANDGALAVWSENFDDKVASAPEDYGISEADAAQFHALVEEFAARLAIVGNPQTRTRAAIVMKDDVKAVLVAHARRLIRVAGAHPSITDEQRIRLGLRIRDAIPTRIPAPITRPFLVLGPDGSLRLSDETLPGHRRKPAGVAGALVLMKLTPIDDTTPPLPEESHVALLTTRHRCTIPLPPGSRGKVLWVMARWYNERGAFGPVSPVVSTLVAA